MLTCMSPPRSTRSGGLLGVREFPATAAGYAELLEWLRSLGTAALAGVEGTGSYGAGLARHLAAAGIQVVEVDRADRQDRHRQGKSGPLDAVSAARAAQSGRACGAPKGRDGAVEAIRALMVTKRSARHERTQAAARKIPKNSQASPATPRVCVSRLARSWHAVSSWWPVCWRGCGTSASGHGEGEDARRQAVSSGAGLDLPLDGEATVAGVRLPAGRRLAAKGLEQTPVLWATGEMEDAAAACMALNGGLIGTRLIPVLLSGLEGQPERPWDVGELEPFDPAAVDELDAAVLLEQMWRRSVPDPEEDQTITRTAGSPLAYLPRPGRWGRPADQRGRHCWRRDVAASAAPAGLGGGEPTR
jgi:Transposase